jgi:NAD(P)-dependent dehydrogenase (short-subunit alcohol dehydrogenase family)
MKRLDNKVAVITGGTRGLGLAIAQAYAREGAVVVVASRSADAVGRAVALLRDQNVQVSGIACNVGSLADVEALATHAVQSFGRFDIWVNNAALSAPYGPTAEVPPDAFAAVVHANILGTYYGSTIALRHFLPRRTGKLINLLGAGDKGPRPFQNAYASSKAWVRAFTAALAKEYRESGVGVYAFNPGLVLTELLSQTQAITGYEARLKPLATVMRLWANPPEVPAQKAVWLASSATNGRTGLVVNQLGTVQMMAGLAREVTRRISGRTAAPVSLNVRTVASAMPDVPTSKQ